MLFLEPNSFHTLFSFCCSQPSASRARAQVSCSSLEILLPAIPEGHFAYTHCQQHVFIGLFTVASVSLLPQWTHCLVSTTPSSVTFGGRSLVTQTQMRGLVVGRNIPCQPSHQSMVFFFSLVVEDTEFLSFFNPCVIIFHVAQIRWVLDGVQDPSTIKLLASVFIPLLLSHAYLSLPLHRKPFHKIMTHLLYDKAGKQTHTHSRYLVTKLSRKTQTMTLPPCECFPRADTQACS